MFEFRALGELDLRHPDGRGACSVLSRPKRVALLAYLVLARPRGLHRRATLLRIFWPEIDEDRGRRALNQSVYVLRRGLETDVIRTEGDGSLAVDPERIRCDTWAFEETLRAGDRRAALELYRGDLLERFSLPDCPDFDRWLDAERTHFRGEALEAARGLARDRTEEAHPVAAVRWLRRARELAPYDETVHRDLLRLLWETGDRIGALREHELFAARLKGDLGLEPSPDTLALVEAIRAGSSPLDREGPSVRSAPDVVSGDSGGTAEAVGGQVGAKAEPAAEETASETRSRVGIREWAAAALLLLALLLFLGGNGLLGPSLHSSKVREEPATAAAPGSGSVERAVDRVAVLPFQVRGDPGTVGHLREGMAELLSARLDGLGPVRTVDPRAVLGTLPEGEERAGPAGARRTADRLEADHVVLGSVVEAGGRLQLQAGLYDAGGRLVARASRGPAGEEVFFEMVDGLVGELVAARYREPGDRLATAGARTTSYLPALRSYLEGETAFRKGRYGRAVGDFRRAVALDTSFALACYRLAVATDWGPEGRRRPEATRRALELSGALLHLARLAALERRHEELARLAETLRGVSPGSEQALEARALRVLSSGDRAELPGVREALRELQRTKGGIRPPLWSAFYARDPDVLEAVAPVLLDYEEPDVRAGGHLLLALVETARGRRVAADERLDAAERLNPEWARQLRALWTLAPFREPSPGEARELRGALERAAEAPPGATFLVGHDGMDGKLRRYLTGLLEARAGGPERALAAAATLEEAGGPLLPVLATGLRAEVLRAGGRPEEALDALRAAPRFDAYEGAWHSPFWALSHERWLEAELLAETGRPEEALEVYATFDAGPVWDLAYRAPAHLRRAELHARLGRTEAAATHYRHFLGLWDGADPELRPLLERARARLDSSRSPAVAVPPPVR